MLERGLQAWNTDASEDEPLCCGGGDDTDMPELIDVLFRPTSSLIATSSSNR